MLGNPHAFDNSIISLMRTLPEPSNFNICWTGLPLNESLRICGELPPSRINSLTIYPRGSSDPPVTLDIETLPKTKIIGNERMIDIILTSDDNNINNNHINNNNQKYRNGILKYPSHWQGGFIALRNFCVPNGTRIVTPQVTRLRDGKVLRKSEILVAGVTALTNNELNKVKRVIIFNIFSCLFSYYFSILSTPIQILAIHILGLIISYFLYSLLFYLGKQGLAQHIHKISPVPHELKLADIQHASSASQPSQEHRYWVMKYNTNKINYDLLIQFKIKKNYQKYWSLVVYDVYGIPIQQFVNLENIILINKNDKNHKDDENQEFFITIRLTRFPPKYTDSSLILNDKTIKEDMERISSSSSNIIFGHSTIDITKVSIGYVIFRIVHPTTNEVIEYSSPSVKLARPCDESSVPKDIQGGYFIDVMM